MSQSTPDAELPAFEVFNEIGIIDQLAGTALERALPPGMTRAQFVVLNHFVRLGHVERSPAQLASAFQVTRPTITSTLGRMLQAGLIEIRPDPADGRGKLVSITEAGRAMRSSCLAAAGSLQPLVEDVLSAEELDTVLGLLKRLRQKLDAAR